MKHRIWIDTSDIDAIRTEWECSCGRSGSADSAVVDLACEKHVPAGDSITYTNRPPS